MNFLEDPFYFEGRGLMERTAKAAVGAQLPEQRRPKENRWKFQPSTEDPRTAVGNLQLREMKQMGLA